MKSIVVSATATRMAPTNAGGWLRNTPFAMLSSTIALNSEKAPADTVLLPAVIPNAGHWMFEQAPLEFGEVVNRFLAE